jgi:lipoprotein-releasing system permease protein
MFKSPILSEELHTIYASRTFIERFLRKKNVLSLVEVFAKDFSNTDDISRLLKERFPDMKVSTWRDLNAHLFTSLKLERICMFIVLAFIIVVASFNIVTTLTLMVLEKKKEIAILQSMGANASSVGRIFLFQGLMIGFLGVSLGLGLSFFICFLLKVTDWIKLPVIYYDRSLPISFDWRYYFFVVLIAFLIVLIACTYPAKRASRQKILSGLN